MYIYIYFFFFFLCLILKPPTNFTNKEIESDLVTC